jgi:D-alanyl-D-alanine carboxypeptidase
MLKSTLFSLTTLIAVSFPLMAAATPSKGPALSSPLVVVQDARTGQVLYAKGSDKAVSMASLTKLMTAMIILDGPPSWLDNDIRIEEDDVDRFKNSSSRVPVGSTWTVRELLHVSLMASDNRAAHALGRIYPGGVSAALKAMNAKAKMLGLSSTYFEDTSGLSPNNRTTPMDLAYMTSQAAQYPLIREFTTDQQETFAKSGKMLAFNNTNAVVRSQKWPSLWLSKTGFTNEAGRCVTMMGRLAGKDITLVLMAGASSTARTLDIQRVQHWLDSSQFESPALFKSTRVSKALTAKKSPRRSTKTRTT